MVSERNNGELFRQVREVYYVTGRRACLLFAHFLKKAWSSSGPNLVDVLKLLRDPRYTELNQCQTISLSLILTSRAYKCALGQGQIGTVGAVCEETVIWEHEFVYLNHSFS